MMQISNIPTHDMKCLLFHSGLPRLQCEGLEAPFPIKSLQAIDCQSWDHSARRGSLVPLGRSSLQGSRTAVRALLCACATLPMEVEGSKQKALQPDNLCAVPPKPAQIPRFFPSFCWGDEMRFQTSQTEAPILYITRLSSASQLSWQNS